MEYVHLVGAEQVQNAASSIRSAAEQIQRSAANIDESLRLHQRFLDDWLTRFEAALATQTAGADIIAITGG